MAAESVIYRCGKCGHLHRGQKSKANWRCPKCEAAYAKVGLAGYQVVFAGALAPSVSLDDAKRALAEDFGLSDDMIARLFANSPTVIKHHITRDRAEALVARMAEAGLEAGIEAIPGYATTADPVEPRLALESSPSRTKPGTAMTPAPRGADKTKRDVRTGPVYRETRPPAPLPLQQKRRLRPAVVVALVLIGLPLVAMLLRWGTVSPCGALKQELRWRLSKKVMAEMSETRGTLETAGMMLGSAFGGTMIDNMIEGMPPTRCATGLVRLVFSGDNDAIWPDGTRPTMAAAQPNPAPSPPAKPPEKPAASPASPAGDLDAALRTLGLSGDPAPEPKTIWVINEDKSAMDDTPTVTIIGRTPDTVTSRFGSSRSPFLVLRCKDREFDIMINAQTTLAGFWERRQSPFSEIRIRVDGQAPQTKPASFSTDGDALFFSKPGDVLWALERAEQVAIEVQPNEMGKQAVVFDLAGMKEQLPALKRACAL